MPRLFVAIDAPEHFVDALAALQQASFDVRWTPRDQLHLTLRFLGDVDEERLDELRTLLAHIAHTAVRVEAAGLDVFPSRRRPRVLVVRMHERAGLMGLQHAVDAAVVKAGGGPADKPFHPHVTFGRIKHASPQAVRGYLKALADRTFPAFDADRFYLYRSELLPSGARHTRVQTCSLR